MISACHFTVNLNWLYNWVFALRLVRQSDLSITFYHNRGTPAISRTPKDSIGAPPVESLYDTKYAVPSPLAERTLDKTQVGPKCSWIIHSPLFNFHLKRK